MASITQIEELRHARADLFDRLSELNTKAESEERDLSGEEQEQYSKIESDFDALTARIERQEKLEGLSGGITRASAVGDIEEREVEDTPKVPETLNEYRALQRNELAQDAPEYRAAFFKWITSKDERQMEPAELRVLSKASAGAGLNTVPTSFQRTLVDSLREYGVMRQISNVVTTASGEALEVPSVTTHGTASWTAENASYSASDEVFGKATLNAYKAATLIKISEELLTDSADRKSVV